MAIGQKKGPGELVDFSVNGGADITPQAINTGVVVNFSVGNISSLLLKNAELLESADANKQIE